MTSLLFKKQIYMEGGCMLDEIVVMIIIILMFIATIGIGINKAHWNYKKKRGLK